jgi:chromosomal replication initiation ATPase DnaA
MIYINKGEMSKKRKERGHILNNKYRYISFFFVLLPPAENLSKSKKEIPQLKKLKPRVPLETVAIAVCEEFGCNEEQIISKGRKKNKAREVAIYLARDMTGITCKDLGEYFGGVSGALITMMHNRIADESKRNKRLKGRIDNIRNQIFKI